MSELLVVGSIGYDSIATPKGSKKGILGGSANYFSTAASMFTKVNVVGVVGEDYKDEDREHLTSRNVDIEGVRVMPGETFKWEGKYEGDMNDAQTLATHLNVFQDFDPKIPAKYKNSKHVFLANIDPELQLKVLDQVESPELVGMDTMNFWISSKKETLKEVLKKVDVVLMNESEAKDLTGYDNGVNATKALADFGPKIIVVKRGEYGFLLYFEGQFFQMPAFPVLDLVDPTGAGDTFAGGFFGYLSKVGGEVNFSKLKNACINGSLIASYTVQNFGLDGLKDLNWEMMEKRNQEYMSCCVL